jgi:hypothetical protein
LSERVVHLGPAREQAAAAERNVDARTLRAGLEIDRATVQHYEAVHDRHPEAGAALLRREERLVDARQDLLPQNAAPVRTLGPFGVDTIQNVRKPPPEGGPWYEHA